MCSISQLFSAIYSLTQNSFHTEDPSLQVSLLFFLENKVYPIQLEYSGNEMSDHCDNSKKSYAKVIHQFKCKNVALRLVR